MEKRLKERVVSVSHKDLPQSDVFNELKNAIIRIIGWDRGNLFPKTIETSFHRDGRNLSPLKLYESSQMDSLNQFHRFYGHYAPFNQRT